jgi:hypothetical protein
MALVKGLPLEAAVFRDDPDLQGWTRTDHLLAALIEVTDAAGWRNLAPHVKKGAKLPKPITIDRPGVKKAKRQTSPAELVARFGGSTVADTGGTVGVG